jgi:hypothetical protein
MKQFLLAFAVIVFALFVFSGPSSVLATPPQTGTISCNSNTGRRVFCAADTRDGVQLVNQRSNTPCVFGSTWGYDRRNIWVDRGCRADFLAGNLAPGWPGYNPGGGSYALYCSSDNGGRQHCPTDTRGGVSLVRQRSNSPCIYGSTWGYSRSGVWVDRGCRADFQIGGSGWNPGTGVNVVSCSSNDGRRNFCAANTSNGVRLIRQRSNSDCIYRQTWGYDRRNIWVDQGCRADFETGRY